MGPVAEVDIEAGAYEERRVVADVRRLHVFDPGTDAAIGQASSAALPGREERACC